MSAVGVSAAGRFAAMVGYVPRACLPRRRRLILLVPIGSALLFGMITWTIDGPVDRAFAGVVNQGLFGLVLPLGALIIGDAVLGAEVRSGAFPFTWLAPVRLGEIILARWLGGWVVALATLVPACVAAAFIAGAPATAAPLALGAAASTAAHVALFVLIGATTRRAAVWSLVIVLLVERLLGAALTGIAGLSPTWEGRAIYSALAPAGETFEREGIPDGYGAVGRLVGVTIICLALGVLAAGPPPPHRRTRLSAYNTAGFWVRFQMTEARIFSRITSFTSTNCIPYW